MAWQTKRHSPWQPRQQQQHQQLQHQQLQQQQLQQQQQQQQQQHHHHHQQYCNHHQPQYLGGGAYQPGHAPQLYYGMPGLPVAVATHPGPAASPHPVQHGGMVAMASPVGTIQQPQHGAQHQVWPGHVHGQHMHPAPMMPRGLDQQAQSPHVHVGQWQQQQQQQLQPYPQYCNEERHYQQHGGKRLQKEPQQHRHNHNCHHQQQHDHRTQQQQHHHHHHHDEYSQQQQQQAQQQMRGRHQPSPSPMHPLKRQRHSLDDGGAPDKSAAGGDGAATLASSQDAAPDTIDHSPEAQWFSNLQRQITSFADLVSPTPQEQSVRERAFEKLQRAILNELRWRNAQVVLFGSGASGLAVHCSDLDIVVAGVVHPDPVAGLDPGDKQYVVQCLRGLQSWATGPRCSLEVESQRLVPWARVPILKLKLRRGPEVDISFGDYGGRKASDWVREMQDRYPLLRPLVLVIKSMLRLLGLHEVYHGGLSSWSLTNMVIAHLMEEETAARRAQQGREDSTEQGGRRAPWPGTPPSGGRSSTGPEAGDTGSAYTTHAGLALLSFFRRFGGHGFDYATEAVSVRLGGCVSRSLLANIRPQAGTFLVLEDPLTCREVAGGSHRMADVAAAFGSAAIRLERALLNYVSAPENSSASAADGRDSREARARGIGAPADTAGAAADSSPSNHDGVSHSGTRQDAPTAAAEQAPASAHHRTDAGPDVSGRGSAQRAPRTIDYALGPEPSRLDSHDGRERNKRTRSSSSDGSEGSKDADCAERGGNDAGKLWMPLDCVLDVCAAIERLP